MALGEDVEPAMIWTCGGLNVSTKFGSTKERSRCIPLCFVWALPPLALTEPATPPVLLRSLSGLRLVKEGCRPCVGPLPGIGSRLRGIPLAPPEVPVDGVGIPLPPRRGVFDAVALIEEDDDSLLILLDEGCLGVIDPDLGVVVPDLGVVPPDVTLPEADDGDNSKGLPSPSKGIN